MEVDVCKLMPQAPSWPTSFLLLFFSSSPLLNFFLSHCDSSITIIYSSNTSFTMLSLRTLARSVPRNISRPLCRSATLRSQLTTPKTSFIQPWNQATKPAYAAFSTSSAFRQPTTDGKIHPIII